MFKPVPGPDAKDASDTKGFVRVEYVYDGDTIRLVNGEKVRLVGIDTPEMHENAKLQRDAQRSGQDVRTILELGRRSYEFVKPLVDGRMVRLEFDVERRDKYARSLAYVYLEDGTFLNEMIIKSGYAYPMTIPPNVKFADRFKELFRQAVEQKLGLWADTKPAGSRKKKR
jgi:micrococcal nuclease